MGIDKEVFFYNIAGAFESVFRAEALPAVAKEGPAEDFRCWARRHIRPLAERYSGPGPILEVSMRS
jgi:hypothetical protein